MKKILFPTDFSEVATNAFIHALEFAKIVHGELILLHTFELPVFDNQFFPENYAVIYDSLELSQFDMFKEEIPKLRAIVEERNLDKIKMSHRLMDGDLLFNIKRSIKEDKIDFVTMNNGRTMANAQQADFIEVGYSVKSCRNLTDSSKSSQCLYRRTQLVIDDDVSEGGTENVLLENISEFKVRYIGEGKQDWVSTWNTKNSSDGATRLRFPEVVEVSLIIDREINKKKRTYSMLYAIPIHFPNNPPLSGGK